MNVQELPALLESTLQKLKQLCEKFSSKSALSESSAKQEQQEIVLSD